MLGLKIRNNNNKLKIIYKNEFYLSSNLYNLIFWLKCQLMWLHIVLTGSKIMVLFCWISRTYNKKRLARYSQWRIAWLNFQSEDSK